MSEGGYACKLLKTGPLSIYLWKGLKFDDQDWE